MKRLVAILVVALATAGAALAVNPTETVQVVVGGKVVACGVIPGMS
jgi:hypothetical protein